MSTMRVAKVRSLWGIEHGTNLSGWAAAATRFKSLGYDGLEIDIHGLDADKDLPELRRICEVNGLKVYVLIFSSWPQYLGQRPVGWGANEHAAHYKLQLELAKLLDPVLVNAHSGADHWDVAEAVSFYKRTLDIDKELGLEGKVCHETHRNRALYAPSVANAILQQVPSLRVTADISHWVVVSERLLNVSEDDKAIIDRLIPMVHHIHARIGTTQASQCPEPLHPAFAAEREFFESFWKRVVEHWAVTQSEQPALSFVPEYGPFPYHPINSVQSNDEVANEEGSRLQKCFNEWYSLAQECTNTSAKKE